MKKEVSYEDLVSNQSNKCEITEQFSEDPLFILYTSGSTGKPKGVLHTSAGYLLHASISHRTIFDLKQNEVYWCTADVGGLLVIHISYMVHCVTAQQH